MDQVNKDQTEAMVESEAHESNTGTGTVTQTESMVETGARERNTGTGCVKQTEAIVETGAHVKEKNKWSLEDSFREGLFTPRWCSCCG